MKFACSGPTRRRLLTGSVAAVAVGTLGKVDQANSTNRFQLFDAMRFKGKPSTLSSCGLEPIRMVYSHEFWPDRGWSVPNLPFLDETLIPRLQAERRDRVVLDIEHWDAASLDKLLQIIGHLKDALPDVRIGYYGLLPVREYWAFQPGEEGRRITYDRQTALWAPLADAVDDLYPDLYTFYDDPEGWHRMADGVIGAGKAFGKPIYPFLWPQYHDKNDQRALQMIDGTFWAQQLEASHRQCQGLVIWGSLAPERRTPEGRIARLAWDPTAPWWLSTQAFAARIGIKQACDA